MNDTEPTYLKRPILSTDCLALAKIARLSGDKTVTPVELQWCIRNKFTSGILYEHEIEGVAHPVAWCMYMRKKREREIMVGSVYCHLEYDGAILYQLLLSHVMRRTSPKYPVIVLDGVESTNAELIQAAIGLGFWNVASTVLAGKTYLEFRYGVQQ